MKRYKPDGYYYNIVRVNVKRYRKEKKYTQQQLAEYADLSMDYISGIESLTKNKSFSLMTLGRIADVLNIDIRNFFITNEERFAKEKAREKREREKGRKRERR